MELRALNERVQRQNEAVEGKYACHGCGVRKEKGELLVCGKCGLAWYCGKVSGLGSVGRGEGGRSGKGMRADLGSRSVRRMRGKRRGIRRTARF